MAVVGREERVDVGGGGKKTGKQFRLTGQCSGAFSGTVEGRIVDEGAASADMLRMSILEMDASSA